MEPSCKSCLAKLFFQLLCGTVRQKLTCKAISQGEVWISMSSMLRCALKWRQRSWAQSELCWAQSNQSVRDAACSSPAQVALRSYFLSFCMELSCQSCLAELFLKLSHGTVVQNLLCEAIFWALAWKRRAKAAFRSYFSSFCLELSSKSWLAKLSLKVKCRSVFPECCAAPLSNGRALGRSLSDVGRNQIILCVMLRAALVHKLPYKLFLEPLNATVVQKLPSNPFLKRLHGTVAQKLPFEAIS